MHALRKTAGLHQQLRQAHGRRGMIQIADMPQPARSLLRDRSQLRVRIAQRIDRNPRRAVQVRVAAAVVERGALSARENDVGPGINLQQIIMLGLDDLVHENPLISRSPCRRPAPIRPGR